MGEKSQGPRGSKSLRAKCRGEACGRDRQFASSGCTSTGHSSQIQDQEGGRAGEVWQDRWVQRMYRCRNGHGWQAAHSDACRERIRQAMAADPNLSKRLEEESERMAKRSRTVTPTESQGPAPNLPTSMDVSAAASSSAAVPLQVELPQQGQVPAQGQKRAAEVTLEDHERQAQEDQNDTDELMSVLYSVGALGCKPTATHVTEIMSPATLTQNCGAFGMNRGFAYDLRLGHDFDIASDRERVLREFHEQKPFFVMLSPPADAFSQLQRLNAGKHADEEERRRMYSKQVANVDFCMLIAQEQINAGRLFLFEQPDAASSWALQSITNVLSQPGVSRRRGDQCPFGSCTWSGNILDGKNDRCMKPT